MNFYFIYIIHLFDIVISDMMYFLGVKLKQVSLRPLSYKLFPLCLYQAASGPLYVLNGLISSLTIKLNVFMLRVNRHNNSCNNKK